MTGKFHSASSVFNSIEFVRSLTRRCGVYIMFDNRGKALYIGKAKNLKKRVASYFSSRSHSARIRLLLKQVHHIEVTVTRTEAEALLLENNLIKKHLTRYNILLRDDKSYPYIRVTTDDRFPRLSFYRGPRKQPGQYFGPYPNAGAVRETLNLLFKLFQLRQCRDSVFKNRARPCLQYQIKRCSAPCVNYLVQDDYKDRLNFALEFLSGNSERLIRTLVGRMEHAAELCEYEKASQYRDQVEILRQVSGRQYVSAERGELDIIACECQGGMVCAQVIQVRGGLNIGSCAYYLSLPPNSDGEITAGEILTAFLGQYYLAHKIPGEIVLYEMPRDSGTLLAMLEEKAGHKVKIAVNVYGHKRKWLETAHENAVCALALQLASKSNMRKRLKSLQDALGLPAMPEKMECFDVSHMMGDATVAACVVFDREGPVKNKYRRFNICGVTPGDDYAAMNQALTRHYKRLPDSEMPDILFIDGGKGQLKTAQEVMKKSGISGVVIIAVAKARSRKPGAETLLLECAGKPVVLETSDVALHLVQQIRDEAHRFAVTGHRNMRIRKQRHSLLQEVPGLGPKRRYDLIRYFGGLRSISNAGVEEISKVPGIGARLAKLIHRQFHEMS